MAELPGVNNPSPPPLVGKERLTSFEREAIEAAWAKMASAKQALDEIMAVFERHPELLEHMKTRSQGKVP